MDASDNMSDSDVLTAVRGSLSGMPLAGPPDVETIMARGRARRHRRLVHGAAGTAAVAAGTAVAVSSALAVTALTPASHQATPQTSAQASAKAGRQPAGKLAAWTVTRLADGAISVTIRELKDPAGLQNTLRADGVPASVTFAGQQNAACQTYPGGTAQSLRQPATSLLARVFPKPYNAPPVFEHRPGAVRQLPANATLRTRPTLNPNSTLIVIDPSALPGNAGVQLASNDAGTAFLLPQVVYASAQCTGS